MMMRPVSCWLVGCWLGFMGASAYSGVTPLVQVPRHLVPVQIPYAPPPEPEFPEIEKATPSPTRLTEAELKRAEALLPLLEGRQELYVIGEFVHLGKPVVPILVKALTMPSPRVRYNAIETLSIIKDSQAVPDLLKSATNTEEMTRVRAHALRVAVKLDPSQVLPALQALVKDQSDTMRRTVAFEARHVRHKEVPSVLIDLLADSKRYVSVTALESFLKLTRYAGKPHDWQGSTQEQRKQWAQEWRDWWEARLKEVEPRQKKEKSDEPVS